ncbi:triphosphate tunnel metalloenzyme 3 [Anaeramoeba flamelloides]|uniref:Triphosphate tunnel metalloenzyme 3 n=1 Tax=Anaeramoeba flamelloides TaxID=1746091 RepID=A0ABQ8YDZ0_9EUKA|nr:triphosphate tunnel metalloenzyme 3 [Anaeramoeba flamelloides]
MEIEIKYRLQESGYTDLCSLLGDPIEIQKQTNHYYLLKNKKGEELQGMARLRFFSERCVLTFKDSHVLKDGIATCVEQECDLNPEEAQQFIGAENNSKFFTQFAECSVCKYLQKKYQPSTINYKGKIQNHRSVYNWNDLHLEIDKTTYDFGVGYEIELEVNAERGSELLNKTKEKLTNFLKNNNIPFKHSQSSKFSNFLKKQIL